VRRAISLTGVPKEFVAQQAAKPETLVRLNDVVHELMEQGWDMTRVKRYEGFGYHLMPRAGDPVMAEYRRSCGATRRMVVAWPPSHELRVAVHPKFTATLPPSGSWGEKATSTILRFVLKDLKREVVDSSGAPGPVVAVYEEAP
jgi:hypothetical protein